MIASSPLEMELGQAWAKGDRSAYATIVERYAPMVHARCARSLPAADADDATQAVFLVLLRRAPQAATSPALAAWLLRVADNVVRNAHRDRRRRLKRFGPMDQEPDDQSPPEDSAMQELLPHLDEALNQLPKRERRALELHYLAGHSYAEIAEATGTPMTTVASRVRRGLERLKAILGRRGIQASALAIAAALTPRDLSAGELAIIRSWDPSAVGSGATAIAPAVVALRWSKGSWTLMHTASLAAAVLVAGTALTPVFSADESSTPPPTTPHQVKAVHHESMDAFSAMMDSAQNEAVYVIRLPNIERTWQRVLTTPEGNLVPEYLQTTIGGVIQDTGPFIICYDYHSAIGTKLERAMFERLEEQRASIDKFDEDVDRLFREHRPGENLVAELDRLVERRRQEEKLSAQKWNGGTDIDLDSIAGNESPNELAELGFMWSYRGALELGSVGAQNFPALKQYLVPFTIAPEATIELDGTTARLAYDNPNSVFPWAWDVAELRDVHHDPDCDYEAFLGYRPRGSSGSPRPVMLLRASLASGELSLYAKVAPSSATSALEGPDADESRFCSVDDFATLPADTIAAYALNVRAGKHDLQSIHIVELASKLNDDPAFQELISGVLNECDGTMIVAMREGDVLPIIGAQVPCQREPVRKLVQALVAKGATTDGNAATLEIRGQLLTVGWQDGQLVATTHPDGLTGWLTGDGRFLDHPAVTAAIKDMPATAGTSLGLVRSDALVQQLSPLLTANIGLVTGQQLIDYQEAMTALDRAGWVVSVPVGASSEMRAQGIAASVLGIAFSKELADALSAISGTN